MINNEAVIEKLITELSLTQMALGQLICNNERRFGSADLGNIANSWLARAAEMSQPEWTAGTVALRHFLMTRESQGAKDAAILISTPLGRLYKENAKLFRGIIRRRGTKSESIYQQARDNLRKEMLPPEIETKDQFTRWDKGAISKFAIIRQVCKSKLSGAAKWLKSSN